MKHGLVALAFTLLLALLASCGGGRHHEEGPPAESFIGFLMQGDQINYSMGFVNAATGDTFTGDVRLVVLSDNIPNPYNFPCGLYEISGTLLDAAGNPFFYRQRTLFAQDVNGSSIPAVRWTR